MSNTPLTDQFITEILFEENKNQCCVPNCWNDSYDEREVADHKDKFCEKHFNTIENVKVPLEYIKV